MAQQRNGILEELQLDTFVIDGELGCWGIVLPSLSSIHQLRMIWSTTYERKRFLTPTPITYPTPMAQRVTPGNQKLPHTSKPHGTAVLMSCVSSCIVS